MLGADEYAPYFTTGQYGRFYIVSSSHARGKTFRIFLLPQGETAIRNGDDNPPSNKDSVEVYGVTGGEPGWTEVYGWLHEGRWQIDFQRLFAERKALINEHAAAIKKQRKEKAKAKEEHINNLLSDY